MKNMTSNKTWHDMSPEEWVLVLRVLNKYMSSMKMVGTCTQYLKEHGRAPTQKQAETLQTFWNRSQGKKQYEKDLELDSYTSAMNAKFKQSLPEETFKSRLIEEIEHRVPIGFRAPSKVESTLKPYHNSYTMDTSNEAIKKSRLEKFDALFND